MEALEASEIYLKTPRVKPHLGLTRISALLDALGHPEEGLACIHIAGTNGKGSTAVFLEKILLEAGYRVGRYNSPELLTVNERILFGGEPISDGELSALFASLEEPVRSAEAVCREKISPFEMWTAAAFRYFREKQCDYVVLETGMGGAEDATNVLVSPLLTILTRISLDHTAYLGRDLTDIARVKAGIIKEGCVTRTVLSAPQVPEVEAIIREEAEKRGNTVTFIDPPPPKKHYGMHEVLYYPGYGDIRVGLPGVYQIENAYLALTAAKILGIAIFPAQCGITFAHHPARMEILRENPLLLFDGGHNPGGIEALMASLDRYLGKETARTVIYAAMADKDSSACLARLAASPTKFLFTEVSDNPRALPYGELLRRAEEQGIRGEGYPTLRDALARAEEIGLPTIVCGSLYLYQDLPASYRARTVRKGDKP